MLLNIPAGCYTPGKIHHRIIIQAGHNRNTTKTKTVVGA
jgi:hypothetical protein